MKSRSLLPGETRAFGPGGHPDPAELTGGDAPPCAEPPVAPTCLLQPIFPKTIQQSLFLFSRARPNHFLRPYPFVELLVIEKLHLNCALPKSQAVLMGVLSYLGSIVITYVWV